MKYEFQWGESHSVISIYNWVCHEYGPYAFGKPEKIDFVAIVENSHVDSYAPAAMSEEWEQMGEKLIGRNFAEQLLANSRKSREDYWQLLEEFKQLDFSALSNEQLFQLLQRYIETLWPVCRFFVVSQPQGTHAIETHLRDLLQKHFGEKAQEVFSLLTRPVELDIIAREQLDALQFAARQSINREELEQYAEKHAWLLYQTYNREKGLEFLHNRIAEEKTTGNLEQRSAELRESKIQLCEKQEKIFAQLSNEEVKWFCTLFQRLAHERLELKNCWAGAEWRFVAIFKEISRRLGIAFSDLMYGYTTQEVKTALLEGKLLDSALARERKEIYAVRQLGGRFIMYRKSEIPALRKELGIEEVARVEEISGTIANPGKARGRAYVVKVVGVDQLLVDEKNFREGDIMVITMTQPSHVSLVKRCAAVVADEGGVASHASVIAREFGKPCIVGAKVATKVIKTGDLIEVDADKGTVKKIKGGD